MDNYAVLQLDIVWCHRALEALSCLDDAKSRLQTAERCFLQCYGEQQERLMMIKVRNHLQKLMRLHLYTSYLVQFFSCCGFISPLVKFVREGLISGPDPFNQWEKNTVVARICLIKTKPRKKSDQVHKLVLTRAVTLNAVSLLFYTRVCVFRGTRAESRCCFSGCTSSRVSSPTWKETTLRLETNCPK